MMYIAQFDKKSNLWGRASGDRMFSSRQEAIAMARLLCAIPPHKPTRVYDGGVIIFACIWKRGSGSRFGGVETIDLTSGSHAAE